MELREFLRTQETETFDFKGLMGEYYKDYADYHKHEDEYKCLLKRLPEMNTKDNIKKWFLYKTLDADLKKNIKRFDCDSWNGTCELTNQIYKKLWQNKERGEFNKFGGDTINSFAYTFNSFMKGGSFRKSYDIYEKNEECRKKSNELLGVGEFARNVGCLGNFTLVPSGFNRYRSRLGDYFDLSLKELKEAKKNWLSEVEFSQFINTFFLWDYTKVDKEHREYEVRLFFEGHSEEHIVPEGDEELKECVFNMNENIRRRGKFMVDMLRIEEDKLEIYKIIQDYLFKKDVLFESIEDARKGINEYLKEEGFAFYD